MPTIGFTTKPTHFWFAFGASSTNQQAESLTTFERSRILTLGQWMAGWNSTVRTRLCLWAADGTLLGQSAQFTVADRGAPTDGNVVLYTADLETPVDLANGTTFFAGFARHPSDPHQVSGDNAGTGPHYDRTRATWPGSMAGASSADRRIGSYVANYQALHGAKVRRSGVMADAQAVYVRRSGVWVEASSVYVRRSGAWVEAS
jgi:hypothetical protein